MASAVGLCVAFVSGLSASHKRKGRRAPGFSILFYIHTRSHEAEKTVRHRKAARSVARPTSLPASDGHSPLSHHARWWKKWLRVMSRDQKRAGGADDETRRNRRRTRTTHLAGHPAASNGAPIRLRQAENQSAPLPCLPSFHTHAGRSTVQRNF